MSYQLGLQAEAVAALLLQLKGYRILARRFRTPVGEIDLVALRRGTVVFVEVKARQRLDQALESLTPQMQGRIFRAAQYYLAQNPGRAGSALRFDLVALAAPFYCRHLDNAWRPPA